MILRIDPKLLVDFSVIAEEGSITRAARRLRVAQPWLSTRLGKLEYLVGFRLFDRTTRSLSLTAEGGELLEAARAVSKAADEANRLAGHLARSNRKLLRIGAAPSSKPSHHRHEMIDSFCEAYPAIRIEMDTGWSIPLLNRLREGELDLLFSWGDIDLSIFDATILQWYGLSVTMARDHPLASVPALSVDLVIRFPVQVFTRNLNAPLWDQLYAPLALAGAQFVEVPEMAEGAPDRIRSSEAVAAFFDFGAEHADLPHVIRRPLGTRPTVPFQLVRPLDRSSPAADLFWQFAAGRLADAVAPEE